MSPFLLHIWTKQILMLGFPGFVPGRKNGPLAEKGIGPQVRAYIDRYEASLAAGNLRAVRGVVVRAAV